MREIVLAAGRGVALVDDDMYGALRRFSWTMAHGYASRGVRWSGKYKNVYMHHLIAAFEFGHIPEGWQVDHKDGNTLNNQRANLRPATLAQNTHNRKKMIYRGRAASSPYIGVSWSKSRKRWIARCCVAGKTKHVGRFKTEIEAARARDAAALTYHGEFVKLNFPRELDAA